MNYYEYIKSKEWSKTKKRFLKSKRFNNLCFICKKELNNTLHIHHKTYKHLGNEKLRELVALCGDCHKLTHFENNKKLPNNKFILNDRIFKLRSDYRQKPELNLIKVVINKTGGTVMLDKL